MSVNQYMNRIENWLIKNEFFANLSLALSILSFIAIFSNQDNIVPIIIYIWLSFSIILEQLNKKKDS
tara:strand:+ start:674 stop:874 length:201 start_codon:yes stop_codon:yes gene_type:complete